MSFFPQYINRPCETLLGYALDDVIGRNLWELHTSDNHKHELRTIDQRPSVDFRTSVEHQKSSVDHKSISDHRQSIDHRPSDSRVSFLYFMWKWYLCVAFHAVHRAIYILYTCFFSLFMRFDQTDPSNSTGKSWHLRGSQYADEER